MDIVSIDTGNDRLDGDNNGGWGMMDSTGRCEIGASSLPCAGSGRGAGRGAGCGGVELGRVLRVLRKSRALPPSLASKGNVNAMIALVNTAELATRDIRISTLQWYLGEIVKAEPLSATEGRWLLMAITGGQTPLSAEDEFELRRAVRMSGEPRPGRAAARRAGSIARGSRGRFAARVDSGALEIERDGAVGRKVDVTA